MMSLAITSIELDCSGLIYDMLLRMVIAAVCGFAIGYERKVRSKEAGIRTHTIVCMAAALMMIVSKYGFTDLGDSVNGIRGADPARIAAQIVSGIGFLGAGIIVYRRDILHGLTTAAGVWTTAAIGMAIGAGMYIIGAVCTVILILLQIILHRPLRIMKGRVVTTMRMTLKMSDGVVDKIKEIFNTQKFLKFKTNTLSDGTITADVELITERILSEDEIYRLTRDNDFILVLEKTDEI